MERLYLLYCVGLAIGWFWKGGDDGSMVLWFWGKRGGMVLQI